MARILRYTTFAPGELEARLREMTPKGTLIPPRSQFTHARAGGGGTLLKAHCSTVSYQDGQGGDCRYERLGPRWHLFHYEYDGKPLPRQIWMQSLGNDPASIEAKARELAASAYREAITQERQYFFQRATEPSDGSRKKTPKLYRMKAARAKELAGKYALCQRSGSSLCVVGEIYDTLDEANAAWQERNDTRLMVACCNRLDRCWQIPRYNPLYALFDPRTRPKTPEPATTPGEAKIPSSQEEPAEQTVSDAPLSERLEEDRSEVPAALVQPDSAAFARWMAEVALDLETLYGLDAYDLPDCPYAEWHKAGLTPEEAAGEAQEWEM